MSRRGHTGTVLFVALVLVCHGRAAQASDRQTVSFLGVYDSTEGRSRQNKLEKLVSKALHEERSFHVTLPSELDHGDVGRDARLDIIASKAPELKLGPFRDSLGDYALVIATRPTTKDGVPETVARLLNVADGSERYSRTLDSFGESSLRTLFREIAIMMRAMSPVSSRANVTLTHEPLKLAHPDKPVALEADVQSNRHVSVSVLYKRDGGSWQLPIDLDASGEGHFTGELPAMPAGAVQYFLIVQNSNEDNVASSGTPEHPNKLVLTNAIPKPPPPVATRAAAATTAAPVLSPGLTHDEQMAVNAQATLPPEALDALPPSAARLVTGRVLFFTGLAGLVAGTTMGFATHVLYFQETDAQLLTGKPYKPGVAITLSVAGAAGLVGAILWGSAPSRSSDTPAADPVEGASQ